MSSVGYVSPSGDPRKVDRAELDALTTGQGRLSDASLRAAFGLLATFSDPTYDAAGNLVAWTEGGVRYAATYDPAGDISTITAGGITRTVTTDAAGEIVSVA